MNSPNNSAKDKWNKDWKENQVERTMWHKEKVSH